MATWKKIALATGTSAQFIKGDGTLDSSTYLTSITSTNVTTALGYTPVTNARTLTINGVGYDLTANRSWTITSASSVATLSDVDLTGLANGQLLKYDSTAVLWKPFTPNYLTSAVTGVSATAPVASSGGNTPVISMAAASSGVNGYMTGTYATKLDGIATSANNYVHPSGDGNLHVPATGVSSTGKVLTAGETANSASWQPPSMSYSGLTGTVPTWNQSTTGNAATATTATNFNNGTCYSTGGTVYVDTLESVNTNDWLELTYYGGLGVKIGTGANGSKALYAGSLYDAGNRVYSAGNPQVNITGTSAGVSSGTVLCSVFDHPNRTNGSQITTGNAGYLHLGQWGAGRTAPGTVLVNTAYRADYADSMPYSGLTGTVPTWNQNTTGNATTANGANGNFYIDDNYGNTIIGNYNASRYQGVFAMGDAYKLPADGTSTGNLYGLAWSHPNAGGIASNLNDHGLLVINNGVYAAAISSSIRAASDMRAPIFYDSNDTNYYLDPNSSGTSLRINGGITTTASGGSVLLKHAVSEVDAWIFQENAANWGLYWKNAPTGNHTFGGYTTIGAELVGMSNSNASGNGVYTSNFVGATTAYAQWMMSNYTGYIWSASTIFAVGDMRAPIFYDSNDTSYYVDPNGLTNISRLTVWNASSGAAILVGGTDTSRVHPDDARKAIVINATLYPALHLNANSSTNPTHGAYISMSGTLSAGGYRMWSMGIAGYNPNTFSIGFNDNMNGNGHYGLGDGWTSENHHGRLIIDTSGNTKIRGMLYVNGTSGGISVGNAVIHTGNIGSQSVSYASTAGSAPANGGTSSNTNSISSAVGGSYTWTSTNYFRSNNNTASGNSYPLQAYSDNASGAVMSFHRSGQYAINMGLDSDNVFRIGGWSAPANLLTLTMSGTLRVLEDFIAARNYATDYHYSYGNIYAVGSINASWSDDRLKTKVSNITNALSKVSSLNGFYYTNNELANSLGYTDKDTYVGLSAQEVQNVLPEIVKIAPFDMDMDTKLSKSGENYMTIQYERIVPLLIEAIKELKLEIDLLKARIN